jgi:hypothetical protein
MDSTKIALRQVMPNLCILVRLGRETLTHYFSCSRGTSTETTKSASGHVALNLCVLHPVGYVGHEVHSGASRA